MDIKQVTNTEANMSEAAGQDLVALMSSRRSIKAVAAPGPSRQQIEAALRAAISAPDHAALRVWRFVLIEQPDIVVLGERAIAAMAQAGKPMAPDKQLKTREWLKKVPLLVGLAYQIHHDNPKVPEIEQTLSMGAAVMNFQNAMHAMGLATFWSTGLGTFTEDIPSLLGCDPLEYQFVGFLAVGTPSFIPSPAERVSPASISWWWTAPEA